MQYLSSCTQKSVWNYKSCEIRFQDGWMRSANTTSVLCRRTTIITMDRVNIQTKGLRLDIWKTGKCCSSQSHFILKASYQAVQKILAVTILKDLHNYKKYFQYNIFYHLFFTARTFRACLCCGSRSRTNAKKNIDFKNSGLKLIDWIIFDLRTNHRL